MTPRQAYTHLLHVVSFTCESGERFMDTRTVTRQELSRVQSGLLALMQKLNYDRASNAFLIARRERVRAISRLEEEAMTATEMIQVRTPVSRPTGMTTYTAIPPEWVRHPSVDLGVFDSTNYTWGIGETGGAGGLTRPD